jgi:hypothetical protein
MQESNPTEPVNLGAINLGGKIESILVRIPPYEDLVKIKSYCKGNSEKEFVSIIGVCIV